MASKSPSDAQSIHNANSGATNIARTITQGSGPTAADGGTITFGGNTSFNNPTLNQHGGVSSGVGGTMAMGDYNQTSQRSSDDNKPSLSQQSVIRTSESLEEQKKRKCESSPDEGRRSGEKEDSSKVGTTQYNQEMQYSFNKSMPGLAYIINNRNFKSLNMEERCGTDIDADALENLFKKFNFKVRRRDNQNAEEMQDIADEVGDMNHKKHDAFVMCILTHGGKDDTIWGTDCSLKIHDMTDCFKGDRCPSLNGKPKLFFIQACRGRSIDEGALMKDDEGQLNASIQRKPCVLRIPTEADFLMAYSTVPGYSSMRDRREGSWFIQALCKVLSDPTSKGKDLQTLLTCVNYLVASNEGMVNTNEGEDQRQDPKYVKICQVPSIVSTLRKKLILNN